MVMIDYAEHFWGDRHIGFHVLYENIKKGEDNVQDLSIFVKERISLEEETLKFLQKNINRVNGFIAGNGAFVESWKLTKGTLELCSEIQSMLVKNLGELSKEIVKYHDELVRSRKKLKEQDVIDAVNLMQTTTTCLQKAKETYSQRCGEVLNLKNENAGAKELYKAKSKLTKAFDEYKGYVDKYQSVRDNFEEKMLKSTRAFQSFDQAYLNQIKAFLITFARRIDDSQSAISQVTTDYRQSIERIDIENIMLRFVEEKGTGTERPQVVRWNENDELPAEIDLATHPLGSVSAPSSSNSSAIVFSPPEHPPQPSVNDLLSLNSQWQSSAVSKSDTDSEKEDGQSSGGTASVAPQFSTWLGRQKITQWRKKHASHSNLTTIASQEAVPSDYSSSFNDKGSFLKKYIKSKATSGSDVLQSEENMDNKNDHSGNGTPVPMLDAEGYTLKPEEVKTDSHDKWSSCSSDEDELEFQTSKIKGLQIKPLNESKATNNSSVDEIRSAVGHIHLQRSSTLDKDPWCPSGAQSPFSQSLNTTLKPIRTAFTGDDQMNRKFSEFNFPTALGPMDFSQSTTASFGSSIARARPRGSVSQTGLAPAIPNRDRRDSFLPDDDFNIGHSIGSLGSLANLSQWPTSADNSVQNTGSPLSFNESQTATRQTKIPIAMGMNEFIHSWFKNSGPTVRVFGTVMVSFPGSFLSQLEDPTDAREPLKFTIRNANQIKSVHPNKKLLPDCSLPQLPNDSLALTVDKPALSSWLQEQRQAKPNASFYNVDLIRYELVDGYEAPLLVHAYWKTDAKQTDIRIDYELNPSEKTLQNPLINIQFDTNVTGEIDSLQSDPEAKLNNEYLTWTFTELSRHGGSSGSLKARIKLKTGPSTPRNTHIQFQTSNTTASNAQINLDSDSGYQLSLVRRKVVSGKYFCEPELR
ncbi:unnamed protein product [Bursaphelenchus okinawaensis]|uniref:MHD domain-containing protein n=1 Tax=Bursaphelenchus okinawaensis TaxID=465554 RepID=A0A811K891_9BILA|nr:unnamed protein product [Bursaphelenchus okinawaensis]CAG9093856.1 unnamed protein product [Bursaphelenchus okinawaensis]